MKFLIYGAGALGQALGCMLAADGHRVDLVIRQRFIEAIKRDGLKVAGIYGDFSVPKERLGLVGKVQEVKDNDYDFILITTKTYDTASAVADIATLSDCQCPVVSMQNGCGNVEQVEARFGADRSLGARVITGFEIQDPGSVRITVTADAVHVGGSASGTIPEAATLLAGSVDRAGLPCIAVEDIHTSLFAKLLYNCALNPLGAILGVHYGILAESEETRNIMDRVIGETFSVIQALGGKIQWADAEVYREVFYEKLIPVTYDHRPSMLQDIENNKPTEVEALVGYVSMQARRFGVATPTCDLLASLVRFKEAQQAL